MNRPRRVLFSTLSAPWPGVGVLAAGCLMAALDAAGIAEPARAAPPACSAPQASTRRPPLEIMALANAGVLVRGEGGAVLIDALFREGVSGYATLPPELRSAIESAVPEFADVRVALVTHWHADHFDPQAVGQFLLTHRGAMLVAAAQVAQRLEVEFSRVSDVRTRILRVTPAPGAAERLQAGGLTITVIRIAHNPSRNFPDQHVAQAITLGGRTVIHVGDADPTAANFEAVTPLAPFDVALVPYWYLLSEAGRGILRNQLRAREVVALHVEPAEAEAVRQRIASAWPDATVLSAPRQTARF